MYYTALYLYLWVEKEGGQRIYPYPDGNTRDSATSVSHAYALQFRPTVRPTVLCKSRVVFYIFFSSKLQIIFHVPGKWQAI